MCVINTEKYDSVHELNVVVQEATNSGEMAILLIEGKLYTVVPAEIAKEKIAEKIALRLAENPSVLHDLQSRLESEKPEEWE